MNKKTLLLFLFLSHTLFVLAQTKTPSDLLHAIEELKSSNSFDEKSITYIDLLIDLGNSLKYSKTDTVKIIAKQTLELSEKINYEKGRIASLLNFGYYELFTGSPDQAITYYEQALNGALKYKLQSISIKSYNGIAQAHFIKADYPDSYVSFLKALEVAEAINDYEMIIKMNANLGTLFSLLEDYEEALKYYEIAQTKFNKNTSVIGRVTVKVNLGFLYNKTKEPKKALIFLNESIRALKTIEASKILAFAYLTKGEVYCQIQEFDKAIHFFNQAKKIYDEGNDNKGEADFYYYAGLANYELNNLAVAEEFITKSLELYTAFTLKAGKRKCYNALYLINKRKGLTTKALSNLEKSQLFADSTSRKKQTRDISMLKARSAFKKSKLILEENNKLKIAKQKRYVQWATTGLIGLLLISVLIFRSSNTKKHLNKELAIKASILSTKKEELDRINSNQDKLFSIVGHDLRGPIVSLKQLLGLALKNDTDIKHFYKFGPNLKKGVNHIHFTLDNLLNWGLIQMKGNTYDPIQVNINESISEILEFSRESYDIKKLKLTKQIDENLSITVDANHFNIIFRNLISNAIKFTPDNGAISVTAYSNERVTTISIEDTGIGMTQDIAYKILNNKEHYTTFGTNNEQGTGLGLVLCKELVQRNNGELNVTSELGEGSTFFVNFINPT
jgi:signal transduction histidine kinase